ncbi:hypothetical protein ABPG74_006655 [Tetrahymena malaccensis]
MKQSSGLYAKLQSKSIHLYQNNLQYLHNSEKNLQNLAQKQGSINVCLQKNNLLDSRELFQKQKTQETINSIHSILTKSSNATLQKPDKDILKQFFLQEKYYQSSQPQSQRTNQTVTLQTSSIEIQKINRSLQNQKERNFLLELPLNQSKNFLEYDQLDHDNAQYNSSLLQIEKSDLFIQKSSLQKRVTFQDIITQETHESCCEDMIKQQLQLKINQETKMSGQGEQLIQFQKLQQINYDYQKELLDSGRKTNKPILKRHHQLIESNSVESNKVQDAFNINQIDMDFCDIRENELILYLIENESCNKKQLKEYFFSELIAKISSNGDKKKKIIFITRNYFYVLQDLYSSKHIQKFHISEISKIIIHPQYKNVCSIIIGNTFQLNLQIKHFNEFIALIKDIFNNVLKTLLPIFQKQNHPIKEEHKINNKIQINQSKMEFFLRGQQKEFCIQIQQISSNKSQNFEQILGLLQIFQSDICISALFNTQELNRLIQVVLLHTDQIKKSFVFKSLQNSDQEFLVKLQDEKDFPYFLDAIESIYSQKQDIK